MKEAERIVRIIKENNWDYYLDDGYNITENYNDCVKVVIKCSEEEKQKEIVDIIKTKSFSETPKEAA